MHKIRRISFSLPGAFMVLAFSWITCACPVRAAFSPGYAGFHAQCNQQALEYQVQSVFALPGETLRVDVLEKAGLDGYSLEAAAVPAVFLQAGSWILTAPAKPGLYPVRLSCGPSGGEIRVQIFVLVPFACLKNQDIKSYRMGKFPVPRGRCSGYGCPRGFIEVTEKNRGEAVSPHFQVFQFLCKQPGSYPKYLLLRPELLSKLEKILEQMNARGCSLQTFHIMSGFRTPYYNQRIHDKRFSAHQWGLAADIDMQAGPNGGLYDFNGDGVANIRDLEILYQTVEAWEADPAHASQVGGMGLYPRTPDHVPFVHIDARGYRARWGACPSSSHLALKPAASKQESRAPGSASPQE